MMRIELMKFISILTTNALIVKNILDQHIAAHQQLPLLMFFLSVLDLNFFALLCIVAQRQSVVLRICKLAILCSCSCWQANVIRKTTVLDVMRRLLQARQKPLHFSQFNFEKFSHGILVYRQKILWFHLVPEQKRLARQNIYQF